MKKSKYIFYLLFLSACVESFNPEIDEADSQPIIVDALLTNDNIRHSVTVNRAKNLGETSQFESISNAIVYVEDNNGQTFDYIYSTNGRYVAINSFAGVVGTFYKLVIEIEGQQYESSFEELLPEVEVSKINATPAVETIKSETGETTDEYRMQISVDLDFPSNQEAYYRFDWNSTYITQTPQQGSTICWDERGDFPPSNLDIFTTCFISENSPSFLKLFTSKGLQNTSIDSVAIYSISPNKRFHTKYSTQITLYNISETAFNFWKAVENQVANSGSLFDSPPSPVNGNIASITNESERIIGIFEVASVTRSRAFFLPSVVKRDVLNYSVDCTPVAGPFGDPPPPRPLYCCDCSLLPGSSSAKPAFWED